MLIAGSLSLVSGFALLVGLLTPIASIALVLTMISAAVAQSPSSAHGLGDKMPYLLLVLIMATALILTGPGAYSLDSRLFGRREIIIPPIHHDRES